MTSQNLKQRNGGPPLNAIKMASVLSTMPFKEALIGWRISSVKKERRVGNWFNRDIIIGSFSVYGKRRRKKGRESEDVHPFSD
jgi:hypothetical protein